MTLNSSKDFSKLLKHDCGQVHFVRQDNPVNLTVGWMCQCGMDFRIFLTTLKQRKIEYFVGLMDTARGREIIAAILNGVLYVTDEVELA